MSFFDSMSIISQKSTPVSLESKLDIFFDCWKHTYKPSHSIPVRQEIDGARLGLFFNNLKVGLDYLQKSRSTGEFSNVWRAAGLKRDEVRNSAVLAWLLDQHGDHSQGNKILWDVLCMINYKIELSSIKNINFPKPEAVEKPYWTRVESCPFGERESRVDIEIGGDGFLLFIEVKIDAPMTGNQLDRYIEIGNIKSKNRPWGVVLLTPEDDPFSKYEVSETAKNHTNMVSLSWNDLSVILEKYAKKLIPSFSHHMVLQYSKYIKSF